VQISHITFGQWEILTGELAHIADGVVVVQSFQVIFEWLAADG
jgi:hypothetical protein